MDLGTEKCILCPEGVLSTAPGITSRTITMKEGYWSSPADPSNVVNCKLKKACPGATLGVGYFSEGEDCAEGRTGPLCAACKTGLHEWGDECLEYKPQEYVPVLILFVFLVLVGVYVLHRISSKPEASVASKTGFYFISTTRLILGHEIRWLSWLGFLDFSADSISFAGSACVLLLSPIQKFVVELSVPSFYLLVLWCI